MMQIQRSPTQEEEAAFTTCSSPSTTTISDHHHHHNHLLDFNNNNNTDSEARVIFADPCSMCGTKKRRVCDSPIHIQSTSRPRKKLFTELSSPSPTFQANSVCQVSLSPSPEMQQQSPESGSSRNKGKKIINDLEEEEEESSDSGDESREKSPSPSPPPPPRRRTGKESPATASASLPPRPPKHRRSTPTPAPTPSPDRMPTRRSVRSPTSASDSEKRSRDSGTPPPDKEDWKTMKDMMGLMSTLLASGMLNAPQKEKIQETIHGKKGILEITDEEHILKGERGVYKGTCQCSCGKTYQMILSILPE